MGDQSKSSWEEPFTLNHVSNTIVLLAYHKSQMQLTHDWSSQTVLTEIRTQRIYCTVKTYF